MISVLYKRYALVFFLLWILAALSLAATVLLSDAAMSGLLLFWPFCCSLWGSSSRCWMPCACNSSLMDCCGRAAT